MSWLWGPLSPLGLVVAILTLAIDQAHKWWMLPSIASRTAGG